MLNMKFSGFCMLACVTFCANALAIDNTAIEQSLQQPIINAKLPLAEVQAFTEARVPQMPEFSDREQWEAYAERIRSDVLERVVFRGESSGWRDANTRVEWLDSIDAGPDYKIIKLRYEALPGMWIPALLYEPADLSGKVPAVLNVNGHDRNGKAARYKQIRCINQAKRGMLALNVEWLGMGQLSTDDNVHYRMNQIDLCGTSGLAPFYLLMSRAIDILLAHENTDPKRVAVAGLSGGGWQTIFISSLDTRVTLSNPVAGYSSYRTRLRHRKDLGDSEQTPSDLATVADYTHLTALMAPRATLLTYNQADDCCFEAPYALPTLLEAARPIFQLYGHANRLRSHVNIDPGTHNFEQDNRQALYRMFRDHFYAESGDFDAAEIASDEEVQSKQQLQVPLPNDNKTLHSLALELCKVLPQSAELPDSKEGSAKWRANHVSRLCKIVRWSDYKCTATERASVTTDGVRIRYLRLSLSDMWSVPAVEFTPCRPQATVILVSDRGRVATTTLVTESLAANNRVLSVDPFYFGESKIQGRDYLLALLVAAVGERPLGIQASQLSAIARWADGEYEGQPVILSADGPRSSSFVLVAAAVEANAVGAVELRGALGTWKEVIENNQAVDQTPEQFCFGLLAEYDILQTAALVAPRPVTIHAPSERAAEELKPLVSFYRKLGSKHDPLR